MAKDISEYEFQDNLQCYLTGQLAGEEGAAFEEALRQSEAAKEELRFSQSLLTALANQELLEVHQKVSQSIESVGWPPPPGGKPGLFWGKWATGLLLLLFLGAGAGLARYYSIQQEQRQYYEALSGSYATPLEPLLITNDNTNPLLSQGMDAYRQGDYAQAALSLEGYTSEETDWNATLYLGISLFLQEREEEAISCLQTAAENGVGPVAEAAQWYLALALLREGSPDQAREILSELGSQPLFSDQAASLLRQMEEIQE